MIERQHTRPCTSPARPLLWMGLGAFLGLVGWNLGTYLKRLFAQPSLAPAVLPDTLEKAATLEARAYHIAAANLLSGIEPRWLADGSRKQVLIAGRRNFREPWARDFGFASFGLLELEAYTALKESLEAFLRYQQPNGQFPIKLHSTHAVDRFLHSLFRREQPITTPLQPKYFSGHGAVSLDGNALLVLACLRYARLSGDADFPAEHWDALVRALDWLGQHAPLGDGLLYQEAYSDWADSVARAGRVLYTNVLYWKALVEMAQAAPQYGSASQAARLAELAAQVQVSIQEHFWRPADGYFITSAQFPSLNSSGNLLAAAWGLATPNQVQQILDAMDRFGLADPVPTRPVHPPYPNRYIALENRLGRIGYYHTEAAWLWIGAWHVIALSRAGRLDEAEELLKRMAQVIVRDEAVHEVYAPSGRHVAGFWYTSEAPLTWSAGMVVYAQREFERQSARSKPADPKTAPAARNGRRTGD